MGSPTKFLLSYQIDWYVKVADDTETTHNGYDPVCSDCSDYCAINPAYRMNGEPINPRSGRSTFMEEKI